MKGEEIAHNRADTNRTERYRDPHDHTRIMTRVYYDCVMINPHCYIVIITRDRSFGIETENFIGSIENESLS